MAQPIGIVASAAQSARHNSKLDNRFARYVPPLDVGIENAEVVSRRIKAAFVEHPNWRSSEAALRELRQEVTFAVYAEEGHLDQVTRIVDDLFSLLQKAYAIQ